MPLSGRSSVSLSSQVPLSSHEAVVIFDRFAYGAIPALAVTTRERNTALAHVATMREAGIGDFDMSSWFGIFAPAHTPAAIRGQLETTFNDIVRRPATAEYLAGIGIDPWAGSAAALMDQVRRQTETYRRLSDAGKLDAAE
jgi:tripartite-type tricarboxylate transporter receptor subunit TctC